MTDEDFFGPPVEPTFSVVLPTLYRRETLLEAIDGVLSQERLPLEIIVLDLGANEQTKQEVQGFAHASSEVEIRYLPFRGDPTPSPRNYAFAEARGNYIAYLDDDDIWESHYLETVYRTIKETGAHFVVAGFQEFNANGLQGDVQLPPKEYSFDQVALRNPGYVMSNMVFHKRRTFYVGGLDPFLLGSADKGLVVDMIEVGSIYVLVPEALVRRRVGHASQWSKNTRKVFPSAIRFYRKYGTRMGVLYKLAYARKICMLLAGMMLGR